MFYLFYISNQNTQSKNIDSTISNLNKNPIFYIINPKPIVIKQMQNNHIEQSDGQFQILPSLTPQQQAMMHKEYTQKLTTFYQKNKKYEIDNWYQAIKQYTYQSFSFPLTVSQAYALHCLYYDHQPTQKLQQTIAMLTNKIDQQLKGHQNQKNKGKYFMKLSTRSPKDYSWDYRDDKQYEKAVNNLKIFLAQQNINQETTSEILNNILYKFFLINSQERLLIQNGRDFIRIFSKSQRIITDINDYSYLAGGLFQKIKDGQLSAQVENMKLINVWVRQWDDFHWQQQFRTFYNDYKLNAITQYDQRCYFSQLPSRKTQITQQCLQLFQKIKPALQKIGLEKGVLDIVIKQKQVKVVQINVFDRDARASLFNWTTDQQILMNGPLEIRVLEKQVQITKAHLGSIMGMIDKKSLNVISDALQQLDLLKIWK